MADSDHDTNNDDMVLSGDLPFFDMMLSKTHVATRYRLLLPEKGIQLLPRASVPLKLVWKRKEWTGYLNGTYTKPSFSKQMWKQFVDDNELNVDDMIVFEVHKADEDGVELKLVIFKGLFDMPEELERKRVGGTSVDHAIIID